MDFISNKWPQVEEMLHFLGIETVDQLLTEIPEKLVVSPPQVDDGLSEMEGMRLIEGIAENNRASKLECYLGAGAYHHHIPAFVAPICQKSEFLTAYTPYQPEISQGMLQVIFEFQSVICSLTGLDVSNASLYDGASACAEGVLMALRVNRKRKKVLIAQSLHPSYRAVTLSYLQNLIDQHGIEVQFIPFKKSGEIDLEAYRELLDDSVAAVLLQSPNLFGTVEEVEEVTAMAKGVGALSILSANPLSYALYRSAEELGVDIAVGDTQVFGIPLSFGGPYVGYIACRKKMMRQLPGRIVGETVDDQGRRGFVLTLQAREQHIRREKATSNICSNQTLASLASLLTILWYGREGLQKLALTNFQRAAYLRENLGEIEGFHVDKSSPIFNEFVVECSSPVERVFECFERKGIQPGVTLERFHPEMKGKLLVAVTEMKSLEMLDRYLEVARRVER